MSAIPEPLRRVLLNNRTDAKNQVQYPQFMFDITISGQPIYCLIDYSKLEDEKLFVTYNCPEPKRQPPSNRHFVKILQFTGSLYAATAIIANTVSQHQKDDLIPAITWIYTGSARPNHTSNKWGNDQQISYRVEHRITLRDQPVPYSERLAAYNRDPRPLQERIGSMRAAQFDDADSDSDDTSGSSDESEPESKK